MRPIQKLESWSVTVGSSGQGRTVDLAGLRATGPKGGRMFVEAVMLEIDAQVDTTSNAVEGVDFARLVSNFRIADGAGDRRYLPGDKLLAWARAELGANHPRPPAQIAGSLSNQTAKLWLVCPFVFERGEKRDDFAMAVEDLLTGGSLYVETTGIATVLAAGVTLDSATITVWVKLREDVNDIRIRERDEVVLEPQTSATSWRVTVGGKWLRGVYMHKTAVGGGEDLGGLTSFTIEPLGLYAVGRAVARESFLMERPHITSGTDLRDADPVRGDRLIPILFPPKDAQMDDFIRVPGDLKITADSTETTPDLIVHRVTNVPPAFIERVKRMHAPNGGVLVADTPKEDLRAWGAQANAIRRRIRVRRSA